MTGGQAEDDGLVPVYVTVAVQTSGGTGPGIVRVPPDEAGRLVSARIAIHGERAPRGLLDGGGTGLR